MNRWFRELMAAALIAGSASSVAAQPTKYTAPGRLGIDPGEDRERMTEAVDGALWQFGAVRLDPWIGLREVAWVISDGEDGDLTISAGAGLRGYLPIGSRTTVAAHVLPTYIWWQDRDEDRRLGGSYGIGLFYFADRASLRLSANKTDLDEYVTNEVDRRGAVDSIDYRLRVEVPISSRLGLFVDANRYDQTVTDTLGGAGDLEDLSSYTDSVEGGLTWLVGSKIKLQLGAGIIETTFAESARDRSNEGEYWLVGIDWRRSKTSATVTVRQGELRGTPGSEFVKFDDTTWGARLSWTPRTRLSVSLYGQSRLSYSIEAGRVSYLDERIGLRFSFPITHRVMGSAYYEDGQRTYDLDGSQDDVSSWGGDLSLPLWRGLRLSVGGYTTTTDSPFESKTYSDYRIGLSLGSNLSFGSQGQGF